MNPHQRRSGGRAQIAHSQDHRFFRLRQDEHLRNQKYETCRSAWKIGFSHLVKLQDRTNFYCRRLNLLRRASSNLIINQAMLNQEQLAALLLKIAVSTSLASIVMRFGPMQRMLLRDERTLRERLQLAFIFALLYGASAEFRILSDDNTRPSILPSKAP